jgi:hypothetical protein
MKKGRGKIRSVYLDKITEDRLEALSVEMSLSRSAVLRMLVGEKWKERYDQFLSTVKAFDEAKTKQDVALMQTGVDPVLAMALSHREK